MLTTLTMAYPTLQLQGCNLVPICPSPSLFQEERSSPLEEVVARETFYESLAGADCQTKERIIVGILLQRAYATLDEGTYYYTFCKADWCSREVDVTSAAEKLMSRVQLEFDDHEKDIVWIIGQEDYDLLYLRFVNEVGRRLGSYNGSTGTVSAKLGPDVSLFT
ncbi:hypothetical protein HYDPIDRAFT_171421 [Hydnomerulius pinastri MD-312]|uniref:Unplaced genomic scaffold scaffold_171, whole genome shotgun sequence n=1 Tax=Hydnomerulius pinastri MD-312 TaxID=994086 RepID=A0A0C9VXK7_9AGAM|nr:hypothetical protein HYDPIDRAFT_171421 [Hydnomerulius pinastri MD-312]